MHIGNEKLQYTSVFLDHIMGHVTKKVYFNLVV